MTDTKRNDWLAVIVNQPQFTFEDMQEFGITPDNTTIKSRDYYKNLPQVQKKFENPKTGKFDETAFENFYKGALVTYNEYAQNQFDDQIIKTYDPYDWTAPIGSKKKDTSATISFGDNPERRSYGISNLQEIGQNKTMSIREIAQTNKVFDPISDSFLDWTPNDKGGPFKALNRPTLVLAQWEENGTHEVNGRLFTHQKGDLRLNKKGEPFYEILGDRELAGRDVLHYTDTLTIDGSKWNKFDFFDSDGIDKSVGGTIMKTAATVAPMLIPGVGTAFGIISTSQALTQLLPILGKSISNLFNNEKDTQFEKTLNKIQNWGAQFGSSVSDKSREKIATFENLGQLVKDVSLQLFQQQNVAKIPMLFGKTAKNAELGRNLALAYMAGTSAQEAYNSFKEAGAEDWVAGAGMLASMFAMWKLMNIDYFRNSLFKGTAFDESVVKDPIKEAAKEFAEKAKFMDPQRAFTWMEAKLGKKVADAAQKAINTTKNILHIDEKGNIFKSPLITRAWTEGAEETLEEMSQDAVNALFTALDTIGIPMTKDDSQSLNFNWSIQNALTRYGISFAGGAIGGPIFELHNRWQKQLNNDITKHMDRSSFSQLTYLLAQDKKDEIDQYLDLYHRKGKFGSRNLSGTKYEIKKDESRKLQIVYEAAEKEGDSQNDIIYKSLKSWVDNQYKILQEEGLVGIILANDMFNLPEDNKYLEAVNTIGANSSKLSDIQNIAEQILKTRNELDALVEKNSTTGDSDSQKQQDALNLQSNQKVKDLQAKLSDLRTKWQQIKNGELDGYYINQAKFVLDIPTSNLFAITEKEQYALMTRGTVYSQLNSDLQTEVDEEFENYMNFDAKLRLFKGYDIYLNASQRFAPNIQETNESLKNLKPNELYTGTIQGGVIESWTKEIHVLDQQVKQLEEKARTESLTDEEQKQLEQANNRIAEINKDTESLLANPSKIFLEDTITKNLFFDRKKLDQYNPVEAQNYAQGLLNYYKYLKDHKIVSKGDKDLYFLMSQIIRDYNGSVDVEGRLISQFNRIKSNFANVFFDIDEDRENIEESGNSYDDRVAQFETKNKDKTYNLIDDLKDPDVGAGANNFYNDLTILIDKFNVALQRNIREAMGIYQEILDLFDNNPVATQEEREKWDKDPDSKNAYRKKVEEYVRSILPSINGQSVIDYIIQLDEIKKDVKESAFLDILNDFIVDVNGEPIPLLQIIQQEKRRLLSQIRADNYAIENDKIEEQIGEAVNYLNIVEAIINGAYSGLNESINRTSKIYKLATIDENTKNIIASEIKTLRNELQTLSMISGMNKLNRLTIHQGVQVNMRPKFIQKLLEFKDVLNNKEKGLGVDIEELYKKYFGELSLADITIENYKDYEKQIIAFESELGASLNTLVTTNPTEFATRLVSCLNNDIWKRKSTKLTSENKEQVTTYDLAIYLTKIAVLDNTKFYTDYREKIIKNENYQYAPTLGQELAIQLAVAFNANPTVFNILNEKIHDNYSGNDDYIKIKPILKNIIFIPGSAGSGKTTAVDRGIYTMLNDEQTDFMFVAPEKAQVDQLVSAIQPENLNSNFAFTKVDFLAQLTKLDTNGAIIKGKGNKGHVIGTTELKESAIFSEGNTKKIIFIDEISTWNEPELTLLSKLAEKKGYLIVATGDETQNSATYFDGSKHTVSGLEDVELIRSTDLNYTMRANSIAAIDNFNILFTLLSQLRDKYKDNPQWEITDLDKETSDAINKGITIKYYQNTNPDEADKLLVGTMVVESENDIKNWINVFKTQLSSINGKVLLITDYPEKYNADKDPNLTIRRPEEAQGLEYDYVLMDLNWNKRGDGKFNKLRNFYTMTQRARLGSIVLNNGIIDDLNISNIPDKLAKNNSTITKEQKDEYKNWRNASLSQLPESKATDDTNKPALEVKTEKKDDKPTPTPSPKTEEKKSKPTPPSGGSASEEIKKPETKKSEGEKPVKTDDTGETPSEESNNDGNLSLNDLKKHEDGVDDSIEGSNVESTLEPASNEGFASMNEEEPIFPIPENSDIDDTNVRIGTDYKSSNEDFIKSKFRDARYAGINNDEYFQWIQTNLIRQQQNDRDSLYNYLGITNDTDFVKLVRQISGALLFDSTFDTSGWETTSTLDRLFTTRAAKNKFSNWFRFELLTNDTVRNNKTGRFLNDKNYDLYIENIGNKRFVVIKWNLEGRQISLPVAIVKTNSIGKLANKHPFKLVRGTIKNGKTQIKTVQQVSEDSRLNFSSPAIISASSTGPVSQMVDTIKEFVFGKYDKDTKEQQRQPQNGKVMMLVTDNPNVTKSEFKDCMQFELDENTGQPIYCYRDSDKYAMAGVHQNVAPSELIRAVIALYSTMIDSDAYWTIVTSEESNKIKDGSLRKIEVLTKYLEQSGINSPEEAYRLINNYIPNYNRTEGQKPWETFDTDTKKAWAEFFKYYGDKSRQVINYEVTSRLMAEIFNEFYKGDNAKYLSKEARTQIRNNLFELLSSAEYRSNKGKSKSKDRVIVNIKTGTKSYARVLLEAQNKGNKIKYIAQLFEKGRPVEQIGNPVEVDSITDIKFPLYAILNQTLSHFGLDINTDLTPDKVSFSFATYKQYLDKDGKIIPNSGVLYFNPSNQILYKVFRKVGNLEQINDLIAHSKYFKEGLFNNDVAGSPLFTSDGDTVRSIFREVVNSKQKTYTLDTNIEGSVFEVDLTSIDNTINESKPDYQKEFYDDLDIIKEFLKENNLPFKISDIRGRFDPDRDNREQLEDIIKEINQNLKNFATDTKYPIIDNGWLSVDRDTENARMRLSNLSITYIDNWENLVNILMRKIGIEPIALNRDFIRTGNSWNIVTFSVLLEGNIVKRYIAKKIGNTWEVKEFESYMSYLSARYAIEKFGRTYSIEAYNIIKSYFDSIQDEDTEYNKMEEYQKLMLEYSGTPSFEDIKKKINDYLLERLKNNEC